jgi:phosphatidylinositol/phosphatidylcholine transfer protein
MAAPADADAAAAPAIAPAAAPVERKGVWNIAPHLELDVDDIVLEDIKGEWDEKELKGLEDFKVLLKEKHPDAAVKHEHCIMRFVVARKFDIPAAVDQYMGMLEWRAKNRVDNWRTDSRVARSMHLRQVSPELFYGFDKNGHPSWISRAGQLQPEAIAHVSIQDIINLHVFGMEYSLERCKQSYKKGSKYAEKFSNIVDLAGLNLGHRKVLDVFKHINAVDERNYPETLAHTFVVNAPGVFTMIWKIIKPWMDPVTAAKVFVLGSDFKEELLKHYDADQLPVEYGGTADVVLEVLDTAKAQEAVERFRAEEAKDLVEADIAAGKKLEVNKEVGPNGAFLDYYFTTKQHDVRFSVEFLPTDNSGKVTLVESFKAHASQHAERGTIQVEKAGVVRFIFDNSHSYWTSKHLNYKIDVLDQ